MEVMMTEHPLTTSLFNYDTARDMLANLQNDWKDRVSMIKDLSEYITSLETVPFKYEAIKQLSVLIPSLTLQLSDLRSSVVKEFATSFCKIVQHFGVLFEEVIDENLMQAFFKLLGNSKEVFSKSSDECLRSLIIVMPESQMLFAHLQKQTSNKSNQIRSKLYEYFTLYFTISSPPNNRMCIENESFYETLICNGFSDANDQVRNKAKFLLFHYSYYFQEKARSLFDKLPKPKQSLITSSLSLVPNSPLALELLPLYQKVSSENVRNSKSKSQAKPWLNRSVSMLQPQSEVEVSVSSISRASSFQSVEIRSSDHNQLTPLKIFCFGNNCNFEVPNFFLPFTLNFTHAKNGNDTYTSPLSFFTPVSTPSPSVHLPLFDIYYSAFDQMTKIVDSSSFEYSNGGSTEVITHNQLISVVNILISYLFIEDCTQYHSQVNTLLMTILKKLSWHYPHCVELLVAEASLDFQLGYLVYLLKHSEHELINQLAAIFPQQLLFSCYYKLLNDLYRCLPQARDSEHLKEYLIIFNNVFDVMCRSLSQSGLFTSSTSPFWVSDPVNATIVSNSAESIISGLLESVIYMKENHLQFSFLQQKIDRVLPYITKHIPYISLSGAISHNSKIRLYFDSNHLCLIHPSKRPIDFYYSMFLAEITNNEQKKVSLMQLPDNAVESVLQSLQQDLELNKTNIPFMFSSLLNVILLSNVDRSETWFKNYGCFLGVCNRLLDYYTSLLVGSAYESENLLFVYNTQDNEITFVPLERDSLTENFVAIYSFVLITLHSIHYVQSNLPRYLFAHVFGDWKKLLISLLQLYRINKFESEKLLIEINKVVSLMYQQLEGTKKQQKMQMICESAMYKL